MWFSIIDSIVFNKKPKVHTYHIKGKHPVMLIGESKTPLTYIASYTSTSGKTEKVLVLTVEPKVYSSDHIVLYFHSRGDDLGSLKTKKMLEPIADATGCTVIAFEYPGYGWDSPSNLSMENTLRAGCAIYDHVSQHSETIVYGYSMGTGIAVEVIRRSQHAKRKPLCVFLDGAFPTLLSSTYAQKKPMSKVLRSLGIDILKTQKHLPTVNTYFIHGIKDDMCSLEDAQAMAKKAGTYKASLWLKDRDHYDTWKSPKYKIFLKKTVDKLLKPKENHSKQ